MFLSSLNVSVREVSAVALLASFFLVGGCVTGSEELPATRLVDLFADAAVENTPTSVPTVPSPKWGNGGKEDLASWKAGIGIEGLKVSEDLLVGRTTSTLPLIHVEKPKAMNADDSVHALEIRMKVSAGSTVSADFSNSEELDFEYIKEQMDSFSPSMTASLVPGEEFQTYVLNRRPAPEGSTARIRHLIISPTDEPDAEVEIESIRVIYRKEHLLSIPTGVSWQGLSNVYRESIVSRSPEKIQYDLDVPSQPWLDLAIGSLEGGPLTFRVTASAGSGAEMLLEKTLTTPHRWQEVPIDLEGFAGQRITLTLELDSPTEAALGVWGSPVIRNRGQDPMHSLGAGEKGPRGVILIVGDTLRRDHLESYGYDRPTAPNLARLAESGALFKDTQAQGVWTKVSVPSILTSLYPTTHGIVSIPDRISAAAVTAAEAYRDAGYATWATSSVPFSGQLTNLHQGVEVLYERPSVQEPGAKTARPFIDYLLPWLEAHKEDPFFVFLHVFDPHSPFEPRPPYNKLWVSDEDRAHYDELWSKVEGHVKQEFFKGEQLATLDELNQAGVHRDEFVKVQKGWYDGSIKGMDDEIGRVLEALDRMNLRNDTLIAFISDHGEEFLERGYPFHGFTVYGEMTNVPLILNWPGRISEGVVVDDLTQSIDLLPTLLELSGIAIPDLFQGKSLTPYLNPEGVADRLEELRSRPAFSERRVPSWANEDWEKRETFSVIQDGWKLVHNVERLDGIPEWELFSHREDPWNLNDVAADHPEVVEELQQVLAKYLEDTMAVRLEPDQAGEGLSEEELEHLRALGYVQ